MSLPSPLPPLAEQLSSKSLTPQRKHRKLLKDGSGAEVWPESIEKIFVQGLREYWTSPFATYPQSRGRSRWRNQFLVDYLQKHNIIRSKKQVASHIQVLRNMWKGEPEYQLVAGGEELADASPPAGSPIKLEDHWSHGLIPMEFDDTDGYSSTSASPDFSPPDFQNQYLPSPDHPATRQLDMTSASHYSTDSRNLVPSASPYSPSFANSTQEYSNYGRVSSRTPPTGAASASEYSKPHNRIRALRLVADGMSPLLIRMDQLAPLHMPYQPLQLKICLRISTMDDINCPSTLQGFLASVYLSHMWTSSGKCITKTIVGSTIVAEDINSLQVSEVNMGTVNAVLPESHLTRCRWLDPNLPTNITQEIIVDGESLLFVIYELDRAAGHSLPSAELSGYLNYPSSSRGSLGSGSSTNITSLRSFSSSPTSGGSLNGNSTNRGFTSLASDSLGLHTPSNIVTGPSSYSQSHHSGHVSINGALGVNSSTSGVMSNGGLSSYSLPIHSHHAKHTGQSSLHTFPPVRYAMTTSMPS
ncbi:hypothetical protein AGABI1DRAFT_104604 [Agaricus bisporus var. burnettii JB137-S8]|uniref:TEA domain-containing protein n=1 Tax=Agaricus bisporus var. burnettii (strain JB137-S8 / ATCC MYA-4627 / FGSC 10392) TaxID=597362 RepID=K5XGZ8_AGABU|nr:uncharacterized protein AGABI1DRAFT_104604 [Agaricus bisporus var. burnettii JB137-S8]EKM82713.1 hypothetical protein AGABI1DRAFT_104604 [Agaricus bisporus var. burnettii JB137-S8]